MISTYLEAIVVLSFGGMVATAHYDPVAQPRAPGTAWLIPTLLAAISTLAIGAFADQKMHAAAVDQEIQQLFSRIGTLEGTDRLSVEDRAELHQAVARIENRQLRVISALTQIKPELARTVLEYPR